MYCRYGRRGREERNNHVVRVIKDGRGRLLSKMLKRGRQMRPSVVTGTIIML